MTASTPTLSPIDSLLSRNSLAGSFMAAPAPDEAELRQILGAAQRVVQTVVGQVHGNGVECEITPEQVGFQVGAAESREIQ